MPDGFEVNFSDVLRSAAVFDEVPKEIRKLIPKALAVTARNIKDDWREPLKGSRTLPGGAASVSYDLDKSTVFGHDIFRAEIGPELKGQGPVVGMLEYGTPSISARGFGAAALQKNGPDFEKGLEVAAEQAEKAAGL